MDMKKKKTALDYSIPSNDETIIAEPDVIENEEPNLDETSVDINEVLNDNPQDVIQQPQEQDVKPQDVKPQETVQPEEQAEEQAEEAIKEKIIETATDGNPATKVASHVAQALNEKVGDDLWSQIIKGI